jgi:capsular polysaccharide biosynthesis protein
MELADLTRMIARYRWLILACVLAGEVAAAAVHYGEATTYTASTRLVLDTADPESRTEAAVIADTVRAIATSPPQVQRALDRAQRPDRKPEDVAGRVSVRALGSSGIIQISVRDKFAEGAATIANALAAEVIETRLAVATGERRQVVGELDRRITALNRKISTLDAQIAARPLASTAAESQRDFLAQQRSVAEVERISLLANAALNPRPSIISRASPPTRPTESPLLPDLMLGALLGLVFGIGFAGIVELVRSSVTGGSALARAFDVPFLGTFGESADEADLDDTGVAVRLALAAEAAGVTSVNLLAVGEPADLDAIAFRVLACSMAADSEEEAEPALAQAAEGQAGASSWTSTAARGNRGVRIAPVAPSGLSVKRFAPGMQPRRDNERTGLVVVSPLTLTKQEISDAVKLVERTSLPLLGLIATASARRSPRMQRGPTTLSEPRSDP